MSNRQPGRPALISREDVVRVACEIADTEGLAALSMRAVGHELGVAPMSLYRHVPNKHRLLEAMVERVAGGYHYEELPADWREALLNLARQQRDLITRHPWLPELSSRYHPLGPETLAYVEVTLGLFEQAGTPRDSLLETVGLFNGFVTALSQAASRTDPGTPHPELAVLMSSGRFPRFAALAGQPHLDLDAHFDRLVGRVIDGLT